MKKISILVLCVLLLGVTGCAEKNAKDDKSKEKTPSNTNVQVSYETGNAVYFNPETSTTCKKEEVGYNLEELDKKRSEPLTNSGCMRWYILNEDKENKKINLLLDHRTTYVISYPEIETKLQKDTSTWDSNLQPRLITASEIAEITNVKDFDETSEFQFETIENNVLGDKYSWLYKGYYASNDNRTTFGYWTSTKVKDSIDEYFVVRKNGKVEINPAEYHDYGIRPVITVDKDKIN